MPDVPPLSDVLVTLVVERLRAIGEPTRIRLLERLRGGPAAVGELAAALNASQQNVSKHLAVLHGEGIVDRAREGNRVVYRISDPSVFGLCEQVCDAVRARVEDLRASVAA